MMTMLTQHAPDGRVFARAGGLALRLGCLLMLPLALTGCAFLDRDNTPSLNWVEGHLWPKSAGARVAVAPAVVPAGFIALAADAFVVHPAMVIDDAASDTLEALWDDFDWDKEYVTECAALPWRAAFTPVVFAGDFLGRAMFDVSDTARESRENECSAASNNEPLPGNVQRVLDEANRLNENGQPGQALDLLLDIAGKPGPRSDGKDAAAAAMLTIAFEAERHDMLSGIIVSRIGSIDYQSADTQIDQTLDRMIQSPDPRMRYLAYLGLLERTGDQQDRCIDATRTILRESDPALRRMGVMALFDAISIIMGPYDLFAIPNLVLEDPDPAVRQVALAILNDHSIDLDPSTVQILEKIAREDTAPLNRMLAGGLLLKQ
jgi:hypothetical protein